jgi:hypothetical protein
MGFAGRVSALLLFLVAGAAASDQIFTASGAKSDPVVLLNPTNPPLRR